MSLKDWNPPSFKPFATRHGGAIGQANERKMADAIGGTDSTRTVIRTRPDGSATMLRTRNGFPEYTTINAARPPQAFSAAFLAVATMTAEFRSLYMTSGAYTFGALGGINISDPLLTVEPVTYKSSAVASAEASDLTPLYDQAPPANGAVSKIYNQTNLPGALNTPKTNMRDALPSVFSGLMRRYMQARYGSGRTSPDVSSDGSGIFIGSGYDRTTGILKFGSDYIFVELGTASGVLSIRYWKLRIKEAALVTGTEAQKILALSSAFVDPSSEKFIAPISIATGTPIAYGWSFSLTTNCASACVNEFIEGYVYDRRMWRMLSLAFTYASETLACSYTLSEAVDGSSAPALGLIWAPVGSTTIWYNQTGPVADPPADQDFPVHAYYAGDTLKKIRWKWVYRENVPYNGSDLGNGAGNQYVKDAVIGEGSFSSKYEYNYGNVRTHGFYMEGGTATTSSSSYITTLYSYAVAFDNPSYDSPPAIGTASFQTQARYAYSVGRSSTNLNPRTSYSPSTFALGESPPYLGVGNHYSISNTGGALVSNGVYNHDTGSGTHTTALVIPANDCSSAYIGVKKETSYTRSRYTFTGSFANAYAVEWYLASLAGPILGKWVPNVIRQHCASITPGWSTTPSTTINDPISQAQEISITLHSFTNVTVGGSDSEIFYTGAMELSAQVQVISSGLFNDMRYARNTLTDGVIGTTSSYPTDITLFVGAA